MVRPFSNDNIHVEAEFPYRFKSTDQLEIDLISVIMEPIPFFAFHDSLLLTLFHSKKDYFLIPAKKNKKNKDLYFRFDVEVLKPKDYNSPTGPTIFRYNYKGYDFGKELK
ncbi:DUF5960 family protein [Enterococcus alishanensis]